MNYDGEREIINGDETYKEIARHIRNGNSVIVGWTDQLGSHADVLFSYLAEGEGPLQGGVSRGDLFVSIMRAGAFAFDIYNEDTHAGYYAEKLNWSGGESSEKLAELINGVKAEIRGYMRKEDDRN